MATAGHSARAWLKIDYAEAAGNAGTRVFHRRSGHFFLPMAFPACDSISATDKKQAESRRCRKLEPLIRKTRVARFPEFSLVYQLRGGSRRRRLGAARGEDSGPW